MIQLRDLLSDDQYIHIKQKYGNCKMTDARKIELLEEINEFANDEHLSRIIASMKKPVVYGDPLITFDKSLPMRSFYKSDLYKLMEIM